jgi:hypothetical protein
MLGPYRIVVHVEQRYGVHVVLNLLRERIGKPGETTHVHPHREVLTFDIGRADVRRVGRTNDGFLFGPKTLRRAVAFLPFRVIAEHLNQLGVVDIGPERIHHSSQTYLGAVRGQLHSIRQPACNVLKELRRTPGIPPSYQPRNDQFGLCLDGRKPDSSDPSGYSGDGSGC